MSRPAPLFIALAALAGTPAAAAELEAVEFGSGYRVRVTATIADDTTRELIDMIRNRGSFPDALLLSADRGDIAAGIELGRFARAAMLPVSAGKSCGDACALTWAGGIARTTRTPLRLAATTADNARVIDYVAEMDAPVPDIGAAPRIPAGHEAWLAGSCGGLTDQQQSDLAAIRALQAMESSLEAMTMGGMGSQASYTVDAQTQRDAARARELSDGERNAAIEAQAKVETCRTGAVAKARARLLD